jgi:alcohol dehydrogenase YqhD (iron-dependent ADH family)
VFGVGEGSVDEKARACIAKLREFIRDIGLPLKVSDWPEAVIGAGDVEEVTEWVWNTVGGAPFGWNGLVTRESVAQILAQVIA